jgi:hypothetical protein
VEIEELRRKAEKRTGRDEGEKAGRGQTAKGTREKDGSV